MKRPIAACLLALSSIGYAQVDKKCQGGVCYQLNIPQSVASSGDGDIFFSISAPTSMRWAAVGQGSQMKGADMFIIYADASNKNITLSPRLGKGEFEPEFNSDAKVTLLEGTGIANGQMTANVRCSSCNNWSGGSQSFKGEAGNWIFAYKAGDPVASDSTSAELSQHDKMGQFQFDYAKANGGSSTNPLLAASTSSSNCSSGNGASGSSPTSSSGSSGTSTSSGAQPPWASYFGGASPSGNPFNGNNKRATEIGSDSCGNDSGNTISSHSSGGFFSGNRPQTFDMAHGILASLAFVVFLPIGGIIIRLLSFPGLIWLHAAMQIVGFAMFIAAFGLGIYIAKNTDQLSKYHPVIGIVVFCLIFFQPFLGMIHHQMYKKYGHRTFWSYGHIWLGRIIITLGIINGGLGLKLADNTKGGEIAYGVVAGIIWLAYVGSAIFGEFKRKKATVNQTPKYAESSPVSQPPSNGHQS